MGWQATIWAAPTLSALVIALFLAGYAGVKFRSGQRGAVVVLFFWIAIATIVWTGFSALKLLQTDPATKLLFFRLLHIGAAVLPPLLFFFVVAYTDRTRWLQLEQIAGVFSLPAIFVALLFFDSGRLIVGETELITNGLVILRVGNGPGFFIFLLYSTALVVASISLLLFEARRIGSTYYPQAALLGLALIIPILFGLLTTARIPPFSGEGVNLVPTSATLSTGILGVLLARYRLFELPPMAYATAMKHFPDSVLVLDRNRRILHANDRGSDLLDRLDGETGDVLMQHFPEFDPDTTAGELFERATEDGESAYYRLFTEPVARGGRRVGWVVVFRDETTQQRQQQRLQDQNEQLEDFSSIVSHDLRNPLNVAQGRLELLREETDSEHGESIGRALTRMDELIEDLLRLSREGSQVTETEPVDIGALTTDCWQNVATREATIETLIDRSIYADRSRLQQLFENVIRNAIEHGGQAVTITVGELADGFYIEDDGSGIAEGDREKVIEAGFSTSDDGTGLGLNIVTQIAAAHSWEFRVTDGSEGGARVEITGVEFVE
jgi:signal transduction histidine kinase